MAFSTLPPFPNLFTAQKLSPFLGCGVFFKREHLRQLHLKLGNLDYQTMFQPTPKRCFTIESLVAKDNPVPASRSEEPIRPAALSYANSGQMNPFLNGFHSGGRGVYSNPDLVFAEAVSHPPNSVPVHSVAPPHALAAHPLSSSHSPHPLFGSQQRDPSTFYPWLLHRYRYLGHRFQGKLSKCFGWLTFTRTTCRAAQQWFLICCLSGSSPSAQRAGRRWN